MGRRRPDPVVDLVGDDPRFNALVQQGQWRAHCFAVIREAIDDALYRDMFGGAAAGLAEAMRETEEIVHANVFAGTGYYPRIDGETAARSRERARGLLKSLLTPEQWAEFEASRKVTECIGNREFELTPGGMIAIKRRETKRLFRREQPKLIERWCVNPQSDDYLPAEDQLIGQLLHLRAGPDQLRQQANVFPV